jgi:hypothetical protein
MLSKQATYLQCLIYITSRRNKDELPRKLIDYHGSDSLVITLHYFATQKGYITPARRNLPAARDLSGMDAAGQHENCQGGK